MSNIVASRNKNSSKPQITSPLFGETNERNYNTTNAVTNRERASSENSPTSLLHSFIASAINHLLTILPAVIATLAATYVAPSDNNCHLEQAWQSYYHNKDANAIRTIQDRLKCCGLLSTRDRAWPFKDATHGDNACETAIGYRQSCLQPWSEQESRVAMLVLVAAILGWGFKMGTGYLSPRFLYAFNYPGSQRNPWSSGLDAGNNHHTRDSITPLLIPYKQNVHVVADSET